MDRIVSKGREVLKEVEYWLKGKLGLLCTGDEKRDRVREVIRVLLFPWENLSYRHCPRCHRQFSEKGLRAIVAIIFKYSLCDYCNCRTREMNDEELLRLFMPLKPKGDLY